MACAPLAHAAQHERGRRRARGVRPRALQEDLGHVRLVVLGAGVTVAAAAARLVRADEGVGGRLKQALSVTAHRIHNNDMHF